MRAFDDDNFEVFTRGGCDGALRQLDTSSDAAEVLTGFERSRDFMRFRLVYDGELKAAGNNTRAAEKWMLRKVFRPQLASLAVTHPTLRGVALTMQQWSGSYYLDTRPTATTVEIDVTSPHAKTQEALLQWVDIGGHKFIPLVRKSLALVCELDILFLRNDAPGSIVESGGDLDNRIKVLFDGLRMPTLDELKVGTPDAQPFWCLLEDDSLISSFAVRTDRLLTDPDRDPHRVLLVIDVKLTALRLTAQNVGFLAD